MNKTCKKCTAEFQVREPDSAFYSRMGVPTPTHCPTCREQRRLAIRNHSKLYKRTCNFTGEEILSLYSPDKPFPVYKESVWWGDNWEPLSYGRDFDFSRPFFEQYHELFLSVPRRAMHQDSSNENCNYITYGTGNKNCYLAFTCLYSEDVYYSAILGWSKDCMDSMRCMRCQLCYECVDCTSCYSCFYAKDCLSCQDSYLLEDCRNCKFCIGCKNLRNKEYHIYNQPVSKEGFESFKARLLKEGFEEEKKRFETWKLQFPTVYGHFNNCENCTGDYIENARDCYHSFDILIGANNCSYSQFAGWNGKDCYDVSFCGNESELNYECVSGMIINNCAFTFFSREIADVYYSDTIDASHDCFGCIGLRRKEYCILNKQYSKEEYFSLKERIIEHMKQTGEWGEFFPIDHSPFAYNETLAQEYFPLTKEQALAAGYAWKDVEERLPQEDASVSETDLKKCVTCGTNYKIIGPELKFYRNSGIGLPSSCPACRHLRRVRSRNPHFLFNRSCDNCGLSLKSTYAPERQEKVYCEKCYLTSIY